MYGEQLWRSEGPGVLQTHAPKDAPYSWDFGTFFFKTIVWVFNNDSLRKKKGIIYNARCSDCNAFPELYVTHKSALEVFEAASFDQRSPRGRFEGLSFCFCDFRSRLIKDVRARTSFIHSRKLKAGSRGRMRMKKNWRKLRVYASSSKFCPVGGSALNASEYHET